MGGRKIFVTGIGTNVGKTVVSAILKKSFDCAYWKPIQAGDLDDSDTLKVERLSQSFGTIFIEKFKLKTPASPHFAAEIDGVHIEMDELSFPETDENLLIEGAGGLMVPINNSGLLYIDVLEKWNIPVVLVSRHYLGSINHTLLSLELLKTRNIEVKALIFVGNENKASEEVILYRFPIKNVHRIEESILIDVAFIEKEAKKIHFKLFS